MSIVLDMVDRRKQQIWEEQIIAIIRQFESISPEELYILLEEYCCKKKREELEKKYKYVIIKE